MEKVAYYTKNKKVYHYTPSDAEWDEIQKQKSKQLRARLYAEKQAREHEALIHSEGYCPKCFILKPLTGICPTCD